MKLPEKWSKMMSKLPHKALVYHVVEAVDGLLVDAVDQELHIFHAVLEHMLAAELHVSLGT